jgi:tetrahydromethanopterin S-methyltransferase subunit G
MDDQPGTVASRLDEVQRELALLRREVSDVVGRSFKWTIVILGFAVIVMWFGVFMIVRGGGIRLFLGK